MNTIERDASSVPAGAKRLDYTRKAVSLASIVAAHDTLFAVAKAQLERDGRIWTAPLQHARARLYAAARDALVAADPRIGDPAYLGVMAQAVLALLQGLSLGIGAGATLDEVAAEVLWHDHGLPTFELTAGLAANLLLTDPGRVAEEDVPWPFPVFRVQLPSPDCPIEFLSGDGDARVRMVDFRVLRWTVTPRGDWSIDEANIDLSPLLRVRDAAELRAVFRPIVDRVVAVELKSPRLPGVLVRGHAVNGLSVFINQPWLGNGLAVQDWLDRDDGEALALQPMYDLLPLDRAALRAMQRIAVNLALYLASRAEDGTPAWSPTERGAGRAHHWVVGRKTKVGREVRAAAADAAAGRPASAEATRHVVRGHFKHAGKDRRRIYVHPYWRGAGDSTVAPKTYDVR